MQAIHDYVLCWCDLTMHCCCLVLHVPGAGAARTVVSCSRFRSRGRYLTLRFTSGAGTPAASYTGFAVRLSASSVYDMAASCFTAAPVSLSDYTTLTLSSVSARGNGTACAVVLYSGGAGLAVQLVFTALSTQYYDAVHLYDGDSPSSPLLVQLTGVYNNTPRSVVVAGCRLHPMSLLCVLCCFVNSREWRCRHAFVWPSLTRCELHRL